MLSSDRRPICNYIKTEKQTVSDLVCRSFEKQLVHWIYIVI